MIRFTAIFDQSGYGNASRDTCLALIHAGYNVYTQALSTSMSRQETAACRGYDEVMKRANSNIKVKINIAELIPSLWHHANYACFEKHTYNIGYFFWETDLLPDRWVYIINESICNEVWVPCEWNKEVCIKSGVKKPIYVIPPVSNFEVISQGVAKQTLPIHGDENTYKFYSIFQWSKRKNGEGLLRAYFNEFSQHDNVMLVIKSYGTSVSVADRRIIKETILDIKEKSGNKSPPPVYFFGELLKPAEISAIHAQCHCYVGPHRGEGWSIPIAEAMAYGKQVVTTKIGGITDLLGDVTRPTAYIIPNKWEPVTNMAWAHFYSEKQNWGSIEDGDIQVAMRQAYNDYKSSVYQQRIENYNDILKISSEDNVIKLIRARLQNVL